MALLQRINSSPNRNGSEWDTPVSSGMRSAGEDLRRQRQAFNLELEDVETALEIKRRYLAAIEDGRTDLLPGPAYAIGFVRAYSAYLGLDAAEILRRFKLEASGFDAKPDLAFPVPLGDQSIPGRGMLVAGLVSAICTYTAWCYWSAADRVVPERVLEVPARLAPGELAARNSAGRAANPAPGPRPARTVGAPAASLVGPSAVSLAAPPTASPGSISPVGPSNVAAGTPSPILAASQAPQEPKVATAAQSRPAPSGSGSGPGPAPTNAGGAAPPASPAAPASAAPASPSTAASAATAAGARAAAAPSLSEVQQPHPRTRRRRLPRRQRPPRATPRGSWGWSTVRPALSCGPRPTAGS